jgi:hypothetical protein
MITETIKIEKLIASDGMTLTNGEVFAKEIFLGSGDSAENWREITDAEAEELQKELYPEPEEARGE